MQKFILFLILLITLNQGYSQTFKEIYNPGANAKADIKDAVSKAEKEGKHVFIMIGFNKCPWCQLFHKLIHEDAQIDSLVTANYVTVMVNYSKENRNMETMQELEFPNRFGFPVFVILNQDGKKIHTQNSAYLEEGKGYNRDEVIKFFKQWNVKALDPESYEK